jgi:hypothetical protein
MRWKDARDTCSRCPETSHRAPGGIEPPTPWDLLPRGERSGSRGSAERGHDLFGEEADLLLVLLARLHAKRDAREVVVTGRHPRSAIGARSVCSPMMSTDTPAVSAERKTHSEGRVHEPQALGLARWSPRRAGDYSELRGLSSALASARKEKRRCVSEKHPLRQAGRHPHRARVLHDRAASLRRNCPPFSRRAGTLAERGLHDHNYSRQRRRDHNLDHGQRLRYHD